ncbi:MAG TPA: SDR family oxidoreductase [Ktedonobacteraceae bacterium]|nr:SDR family oxidoreductase [Ktedonobacteraceae bacterium]
MDTQTEYPLTLHGKRIVVLGGTSGIGFATAAMAAREGAAIVVASSRRESVDRAVARLPKGTEGHAIDLAKEEHVRDFFNHLGAFDHIVFTAGEAMQFEELSEINVEQARHFFDLRFWGAFMAAKYGSSQIRPGGSIVLTSGIAGRRPRNGLTVGAGISGAVEALTRALAIELAPIRVNAVCPGPVITEMWGSMSEEDHAAMSGRIGQALPVGRAGEPHDQPAVPASI